MSNARKLADLLDSAGDVKSAHLDNVPASDNASALTSGTLPIARIADDAITNAKMADDAIDSAQIASGAVDDAHLATGITASKLTGAMPAIDGSNLTGLSSFNPDGAVVFNESSADVDFRVESDSKSHMLFVDGGNNRVQIGSTGNPDEIFEVHGTVSAGASTDEVIQEWAIGSDNVKANIEYTDVSTSRGMNFGTSTGHDLILKTNDTTRLTLTGTGLGLSQFTAKAWWRFTADGTVTIADSHNISSVSDTGTGDWRVNYDVDLASANHSVSFQIQIFSQYGDCSDDVDNMNAGYVDVIHREGGSATDSARIMGMVFGDTA